MNGIGNKLTLVITSVITHWNTSLTFHTDLIFFYYSLVCKVVCQSNTIEDSFRATTRKICRNRKIIGLIWVITFASLAAPTTILWTKYERNPLKYTTFIVFKKTHTHISNVFERTPKTCSGGQDRRSFHTPGTESHRKRSCNNLLFSTEIH